MIQVCVSVCACMCACVCVCVCACAHGEFKSVSAGHITYSISSVLLIQGGINQESRFVPSLEYQKKECVPVTQDHWQVTVFENDMHGILLHVSLGFKEFHPMPSVCPFGSLPMSQPGALFLAHGHHRCQNQFLPRVHTLHTNAHKLILALTLGYSVQYVLKVQ